MTLNELNQLSDKEFSSVAGKFLDYRMKHDFVDEYLGSVCIFCGSKNEKDPCMRVDIPLDWNTAMPLIKETNAVDIVGGNIIYYVDHKLKRLSLTERNLITAVLLARGLVEGE